MPLEQLNYERTLVSRLVEENGNLKQQVGQFKLELYLERQNKFATNQKTPLPKKPLTSHLLRRTEKNVPLGDLQFGSSAEFRNSNGYCRERYDQLACHYEDVVPLTPRKGSHCRPRIKQCKNAFERSTIRRLFASLECA